MPEWRYISPRRYRHYYFRGPRSQVLHQLSMKRAGVNLDASNPSASLIAPQAPLFTNPDPTRAPNTSHSATCNRNRNRQDNIPDLLRWPACAAYFQRKNESNGISSFVTYHHFLHSSRITLSPIHFRDFPHNDDGGGGGDDDDNDNDNDGRYHRETQANERTNELRNERTNERTLERTNERTSERTDERTSCQRTTTNDERRSTAVTVPQRRANVAVFVSCHCTLLPSSFLLPPSSLSLFRRAVRICLPWLGLTDAWTPWCGCVVVCRWRDTVRGMHSQQCVLYAHCGWDAMTVVVVSYSAEM